MGRVAGLDVGTKTIGIACSDPLRMLASPVRTLKREGVKKDAAKILQWMAEVGVDQVVVGLPYELDGSEGRSARLARQIAAAVREGSGVEVGFIDERFTSVEAERQLIEVNMSRAKRKKVIDQQAAVLILESYLNHSNLLERE